MAAPMVTVATPPRTPRLGGIATVANIITVSDHLFFADGVEWPAAPCGFVLETATDCWGQNVNDPEEDRPEKDLDNGFSYAESGLQDPIYFGVECFTGSGEDFDARARQGLEEAGDRYFEKRAYINLTTTATALTDAADLVEAVAALEDFLDDVEEDGYIARPVIWVNRGDAVRLAAAYALFPDGVGGLTTANGTPVIASSEFEAGTLFGTGQPTVFVTDIAVNRALDQTVNREMAIAERTFAIGFDCDIAAKIAVETD